jgi:hypothetical protein
MKPAFQIIVFHASHLFLLGIGVVIISYKMENPVDNHPVQLGFKVSGIKPGIVTDGIYAYEKVSGKDILLTVIEGDDVCIIIVAKIFSIDIQKIGVGAKYDVNLPDTAVFAFSDSLEPAPGQHPVPERKNRIFDIKPYHSGMNLEMQK